MLEAVEIWIHYLDLLVFAGIVLPGYPFLLTYWHPEHTGVPSAMLVMQDFSQ